MNFIPNPATGEGYAFVAFRDALASVEGVVKSETADMGKYTVRYASLNAVHAECGRACALHKLAISQEPTVHDGMFAVLTTLIHEDGSLVVFEPMCLPMPREAQALGSATTYLRRYSLVAQFGLHVADDDGREATVAAQTAPGRRTEAERMIREQVALLDPEDRKKFVADFHDQFHSTLADLPTARHGDALTWARGWKPPQTEPQTPDDAADAAWVQAAQQPVAGQETAT